jgi:hypothetical protein
MVKNKLVEAMKSNIKSVVLEIETFIKNRESIIALISFTPVNLLVDYANHLNLFLKTRPLIRAAVLLQEGKRALSGKRNLQGLIYKRCRLSL